MRRSTALAAAAMTLLSACGGAPPEFRAGRQVHITSPAENAKVHTPFTLTWSTTRGGVRYVVLFDRSPMKPGKSLLSLVGKTDPCRSQPVCPDDTWLSNNHIYVTGQTSVAVDSITDMRNGHRSTDAHTVTIVLIDRSGKRIGEAAYLRNFIVDRGTA